MEEEKRDVGREEGRRKRRGMEGEKRDRGREEGWRKKRGMEEEKRGRERSRARVQGSSSVSQPSQIHCVVTVIYVAQFPHLPAISTP